MRVKCHGCQAGWDFPDDTSLARCPSCQILAVAPSRKSLMGVAESSEPTDHQILGLPADARGTILTGAWAAFLGRIPFERFPAAFRQGRLAFDRLNAAVESDRLLWRWPIAGRCLACDESERFGFRACVLCRGALSPASDDVASYRTRVASAAARVSAALREAEARWRTGRLAELLAAVERGLAERDAEDDARARLDLLAGHALASQGSYAEAEERWSRASANKGEAAEARVCLAALADRRNIAEGVLHHAGSETASETMTLLAGSALSGIGRGDDAIARLAPLFESKSDRIAARAHWAAAATEYAGGNPTGVFPHLRVAVSAIIGRDDDPSLLDSLAPVEIAKLQSHMIWLAGVTFSALGHAELAESWLSLGQQLAPTDASFPRERGMIALRATNLAQARALFDEAERRGDAGGAARGRAVASWLDTGELDAAPLFAAAENLQDPILFYHAGRQLERTGDAAQAAKAYARATVLDPLMGRAFASLGVLFARGGDSERAIGALTRARVAGERGTMVIKALATLLLERGRLDEAIPLLEQILEGAPEDASAKRNLAGAKRLLALEYANDEKEEEALESLEEAAAADPEGAGAWSAVAAELGFRAASRLSMLRPSGWTTAAEELLDAAAKSDPSNLRVRLRLGVVRLADALAEQSEDGNLSSEMIRSAIATLQSVAAAPSTPAPLRFGAELHRAIALHSTGATKEADEITSLLAKHPALDAASRLRARWVQSLSLARSGKPVPARVLLEESARECENLPGASEFLKRVRLQILKLQAEERGAQRIEREILALEPHARSASMMLLYGLVLAEQKRFDDAAQALEAAAKDPSLRREAHASRTLMQLWRVADLLVQRKEAEAHKLLGRLRPSLPQDTEIDLWLNSLEVEGVPLAALRQGDGRSAVAVWSSRAQRWRKKDSEYWELVRSIAIAAHLTAVRAEKAHNYYDAEVYWKTAVSRWLELFDAEEFWQAYARRGQDLFPGLEPEIIDAVRGELLDTNLVGLIREAIAHQRQIGDDLVAMQRFSLLEQIESWRLSKNPADESVRKNLASCHAQRLILASKHQMWKEALEFGEKACETDASDPVHFNNMAEVYGAKLQPILANLQAQYQTTGPGPHLRTLAVQVVELASLALAWNPHHKAFRDLLTQMAPQLGYAGVPPNDPRVQRASALRERLPQGALEQYMASLAESQAPQQPPAAAAGAPAPHALEFSEADAHKLMDLVKKMKAAGLSRDAIYTALLNAFPSLAQKDKQAVMSIIDAM